MYLLKLLLTNQHYTNIRHEYSLPQEKDRNSTSLDNLSFDASHFVVLRPPVSLEFPSLSKAKSTEDLRPISNTCDTKIFSNEKPEAIQVENGSDKSREPEPPSIPVMAEIVETYDLESLPSITVKPDGFNDGADEASQIIENPVMFAKLSVSKSPIMEALIYCSFNRWGVEIVKMDTNDKWVRDDEFGLGVHSTASIGFRFFDFDFLCSCLERVNAKHKPTTDTGARMKALRRWFDNVPNVRSRNEEFIATVRKTEQLEKVKEMIRRILKIYLERVQHAKETKYGKHALASLEHRYESSMSYKRRRVINDSKERARSETLSKPTSTSPTRNDSTDEQISNCDQKEKEEGIEGTHHLSTDLNREVATGTVLVSSLPSSSLGTFVSATLPYSTQVPIRPYVNTVSSRSCLPSCENKVLPSRDSGDLSNLAAAMYPETLNAPLRVDSRNLCGGLNLSCGMGLGIGLGLSLGRVGGLGSFGRHVSLAGSDRLDRFVSNPLMVSHSGFCANPLMEMGNLGFSIPIDRR
eukprot:TRINITY_DN9831_c0_g1_i2.p1 TRINITY_DN9831_c0_g1~~TRINITY_DN9831_c0_g1_i2.p1  ORF type:complete len:549 (+),score=86.09 TRINITY_DN9831_c0_g1_i2:80-1648(+)